MKKKFLSILTVCLVMFSIFIVPVSAATHEAVDVPREVTIEYEVSPYATNYFSGTSGILNAVSGSSKDWLRSSGSVPAGATVTKVELTAKTTTSGASGTMYILHPNGSKLGSVSVNSTNKTTTLTTFNGLDPYGTWTMWFTSSGIATVSGARIVVTYQY